MTGLRGPTVLKAVVADNDRERALVQFQGRVVLAKSMNLIQSRVLLKNVLNGRCGQNGASAVVRVDKATGIVHENVNQSPMDVWAVEIMWNRACYRLVRSALNGRDGHLVHKRVEAACVLGQLNCFYFYM